MKRMTRILRACIVLSVLAAPHGASASTVTATVMNLLGGRNHPPSPELLEEVLITDTKNQTLSKQQQFTDPEETVLTPPRTVFKAQRQGTTIMKGERIGYPKCPSAGEMLTLPSVR